LIDPLKNRDLIQSLRGSRCPISMPGRQPPRPSCAASPANVRAAAREGCSQGFLTLRPSCDQCEQDYSFIDAGDGPAVFIILIAGFIVVGAALIVEVKFQPPLWVHAALWIPLILAVTLWPLRAMKSLMISLQFHHGAAEARPVRQNRQ
jgi:uncharacterized protein (DUF983 family)